MWIRYENTLVPHEPPNKWSCHWLIWPMARAAGAFTRKGHPSGGWPMENQQWFLLLSMEQWNSWKKSRSRKTHPRKLGMFFFSKCLPNHDPLVSLTILPYDPIKISITLYLYPTVEHPICKHIPRISHIIDFQRLSLSQNFPILFLYHCPIIG